MKNFIQDGHYLDLTAPRALTSGEGFQVGSLFAVATTSTATGTELSGAIVGVFDLAKASGEAWNTGDPVHWDDTAHAVTTAAAGNTLIGCAVAIATTTATTGRVRLNGTVA
ncbi:MAG: hypothetical protein FD149_2230 [Rhodospirillaceae bacterium]|nr:MAG: hypothetical protein FD149_2230 [Rhodospirillaceae bacterium]